jgi:subtilisin family serine protease
MSRNCSLLLALTLFGVLAIQVIPGQAEWNPINYRDGRSNDGDPRVVRVPEVLDLNHNRITDRLEQAVAERLAAQPGPLTDTTITSLIDVNTAPDASMADHVAQYGGQVLRTWNGLVYTMLVELPARSLAAYVRNNSEVILAEPNPDIQPDLEYATRQMQVRSVWNKVPNGVSYRGDPAQTVAVMDTGIDDSHPDFAGRIVAWKDLVGVHYDVQGDEYTSPSDVGGHGSAVSGVVGGSGQSAGAGKIPMSYFGLFPKGGASNSHYFPIYTGTGESTIYAEMQWLVDVTGDLYQVEVRDESNVSLGKTKSSAEEEPLKLTTSAVKRPQHTIFNGLYFSLTGDPADTSDTPYFGKIITPYTALDSFPLLSGVAPLVSLAVIKVFDDFGSSKGTQTILDAIQWIRDNAKTSHIICVNASLSVKGEMIEAIDTAVNNLVSFGVTFVVSAGNYQKTNPVGSPGTASKALTVAAVSSSDAITSYSSLGDPNRYTKPDVAAPGGSAKDGDYITTVDTNDSDDPIPTDTTMMPDMYPNDYIGITGTSFSSPYVAGLVALMADALDRNWTYDSIADPLMIKMLICMTATEVQAGEDSKPQLNRGIKDRIEGYGRINADAAIEALKLTMLPGNQYNTQFGVESYRKKAWARGIALTSGVQYTFQLALPPQGIFDLYLYQRSPDSEGEPVIASKTLASSKGEKVQLVYTPDKSDTFYVVAKWVAGSENAQIRCTTPGLTPISVAFTEPADFTAISSTKNSVTVKGTVTNATSLKIRLNSGSDQTVSFDGSGNFSLTLNLSEGENQILASVSNGQSMTGEAGLKLIYTAILDSDGDGYGVDVDCDDTNPNIYPDATEICDDKIDNDCDNLVDLYDISDCQQKQQCSGAPASLLGSAGINQALAFYLCPLLLLVLGWHHARRKR